MEMALLLVVLVVIELALTTWFLARQKMYRDEMASVRGKMHELEHDLLSIAGDCDKDSLSDEKDSLDVASLVQGATEEDLKQAAAIIQALGLNKED